MSPITPEIEQAARALGQALRANPAAQAYLEASQRVAADPEVAALEKELYETYESLIARQQKGERIQREEVQAFNVLRNRFFSHPLVQERESALQPLKSLFIEAAVEISAPLGVDYTKLAQKG